MKSTGDIINNEKAHQFELVIEGETAMIVYEKKGNVYNLIHTEVPDALTKQGIGKELVNKTLHYIEEHRARVIPSCTFVQHYLKQHPEWNKLLA